MAKVVVSLNTFSMRVFMAMIGGGFLSYSAIEDVGNTLLKLLRDNIPSNIIDDPEAIGMVSPMEQSNLKLILYLYNVEENYEVVKTGMERTSQAPLFLDLYFLVLANSKAELKSRAQENSRIIGCAMKILNENSVLCGSVLQGSLEGDGQCIKINIQNPYDDSFTSKLRETSELVMKTLVCYKVGPVSLGEGNGGREASRVL